MHAVKVCLCGVEDTKVFQRIKSKLFGVAQLPMAKNNYAYIFAVEGFCFLRTCHTGEIVLLHINSGVEKYTQRNYLFPQVEVIVSDSTYTNQNSTATAKRQKDYIKCTYRRNIIIPRMLVIYHYNGISCIVCVCVCVFFFPLSLSHFDICLVSILCT